MQIPVYSLTIDEMKEDYGVSVISFVESPAIEKTFLALSKQKELKLSVNTEKRIVTGVALRADFPIYRKSNGKEFYFTVSQDEMEKIMQKFMLEKRGDAVNIEHEKNASVNNVFLIESFLLTDHHKLAYPEFSDVESGSWMVSYKVNNDKVWEAVKDGKLKGFSVELVGDLDESKAHNNLSYKKKLFELLTIIDKTMKLKTKIALKLAKEVGIELSEHRLDDVTFHTMEDGELEVGQEVFELDDSGAYIMPADGNYKYGERVVVITDGVVTAIEEGESAPPIDEPIVENLSSQEVEEITKTITARLSKKNEKEISEVKEKLKKTEVELSKVKEQLKKASAGNFEKPNPSNAPEQGEKKKSQLADFNLQ